MADRALVLLLALELEDDDLGRAALALDGCLDLGVFDRGASRQLVVLGNREDPA